MANENYEKNGKKFLKCKECGAFKELNDVNWYRHPEGFMGVLGRCKECIKSGRKTEREINISRKRDRERYENNPKRRSYINKWSRERTKRHLLENKYWVRNHERTNRLIKKLGIRPKTCPLCGYEGRIVAHHPDINIWNQIVFCCQPCHDKIHRGKIKCPTTINILNPNKSNTMGMGRGVVIRYDFSVIEPRIVMYCVRNGYNEKQFCEKVKIAQGTLNNWRKSGSIPANAVRKLKRHISIDFMELTPVNTNGVE